MNNEIYEYELILQAHITFTLSWFLCLKASQLTIIKNIHSLQVEKQPSPNAMWLQCHACLHEA